MKKLILLVLTLCAFASSAQEKDEPSVPQGMTQLKAEDLLDKMDFDPSKIPANASGEVKAEDLPSTAIPLVEYVIDSSGSMGQLMGPKKTKIYVLKKLLARYLMSQWTEKTSSGLRVIGSRRKKDCKDNYLAIEPAQSKLGAIEGIVKGFEPVGMTPIGQALKDAYKDVEHYKGPKRVVLFTDGEETCGQDPCKIAAELSGKDVDLKFFVVAFGLQNQPDVLDKLACIGDMSQADDEEKLEELFQDLDKQLNPGKNLFVSSPQPNATVFLFRADSPNEIYRKFHASQGIEVPPGKYLAIVNLKPKYKFSEFVIPPKKKVTLKVGGQGFFQANFVEKLMKIELLDTNRKVVKRFTSDVRVPLPTGKWAIRLYRDPFFEKTLENYLIVPNAEYTYDVQEAGALVVEDAKVRGIYVYDGRFALLGNHLTNVPLVLGKGVYEVRVDEKCVFKDVIMGSNSGLVKLDCSKVKNDQ
ncbi:VWA domain-containing protein [Bdellovibrio bacteriovorus]|uniref:Putative secreted protein n=1 Tax=Bdellovibrio bacteriovorus (strain ATCC 15356 / DSM 50701 / NCIMB 9529 / HD100) TaxID=264462 RepID=Q6MIX1_BDEBA|nr:VWA domain-containing protein [Bdellovibrio bacteriovorus]CAE80792.1 putative secreted protein [Bdellovibrio bacteriovorus HD100]